MMFKSRLCSFITCFFISVIVLSGCKSQTIQSDEEIRVRKNEIYALVCERGIILHCLDQGIVSENVDEKSKQRIAKIYKALIAEYKRKCDTRPYLGSYAHGCSNLGMMYKYGNAVELDHAKAVALFQEACDRKGRHGCHNLGIMYEDGTGLNQSSDKAASLFKKNCSGGFKPSCNYQLYLIYKHGIGTKINHEKSVKFLQQACDEDDIISCTILKRIKAEDKKDVYI
ncbi:tetratricopeptide repeat protein [Kiloniella majae]|uniref:tetratricopeptide repeat protein n=1 Tax=Kiloniella majae TaxID=1938558 RepID=UPI000A277786|nr:tetratricopeptide repeat protein [Kiloniella majae]